MYDPHSQKELSFQEEKTLAEEYSQKGIFDKWMLKYTFISVNILTKADILLSDWKLDEKDSSAFGNLLKVLKHTRLECLFDKIDVPEKETTEMNEVIKYIKNMEGQNFDDFKYGHQILFFYAYVYNMCYYNQNKKQLLIEYSKIIRPIVPKYPPRILKHNRLRVGFVSLYLQKLHSVFKDRSGIIMNLPSDIFEKHLVIGTRNPKSPTPLHDTLYKSCEYIWDACQLENIQVLVKLILKLEFDVLVFCDIGMSPESIYLSQFRLAPIQVNTWGHSVTSGSYEIDYFISSKWFEIEEESQKHYTEKLILFDSLSTYYPKILNSSNKTFDELRKYLPLSENTLQPYTYIECLQMPQKIGLEFYRTLEKIVRGIDTKIMLLKIKHSPKKQKKREDLIISELGKDFHNKLIFIEYLDFTCYHFMKEYALFSLDVHPFGGCNSSLECFSFGKVLVTLPTQYLSGRFSLGFYKKMGIMDVVAKNKEDYIHISRKLILDHNFRQSIENKIKKQNHLLFCEKDSILEWINCLQNLKPIKRWPGSVTPRTTSIENTKQIVEP